MRFSERPKAARNNFAEACDRSIENPIQDKGITMVLVRKKIFCSMYEIWKNLQKSYDSAIDQPVIRYKRFKFQHRGVCANKTWKIRTRFRVGSMGPPWHHHSTRNLPSRTRNSVNIMDQFSGTGSNWSRLQRSTTTPNVQNNILVWYCCPVSTLTYISQCHTFLFFRVHTITTSHF